MPSTVPPPLTLHTKRHALFTRRSLLLFPVLCLLRSHAMRDTLSLSIYLPRLPARRLDERERKRAKRGGKRGRKLREWKLIKAGQ
jgi:hypothetical protein